MTSLDPLYRIGDQIAAAAHRARRPEHGAGPRARARTSRTRAHPRPGTAHRLLSARAVRRPAPARHDRDGARQRSRRAHRRRADDGARRHRPGADPRPARRPAEAPRHVDRVHHPRSRHRAPLRRPHLRDEDAARWSRAATTGDIFADAEASLYRACCIDAEPRGPQGAGRRRARRSCSTPRNIEVDFPARRRASSAGTATCCARSTASASRCARGETIGVVGESGSGKSTLGRAHPAPAARRAGMVRFEDRNLMPLDRAAHAAAAARSCSSCSRTRSARSRRA